MPEPRLDLVGTDATGLSLQVRSRTISACGVTEQTLERIEAVEPDVNAFRVVMADTARADAARLDSMSDDQLADLPLAGVPVAIKDDTDVAGQSTMWGTAIDRGLCQRNAAVVERLREAGAIIIGKTNVPELTLWPWTDSVTWGTTRNPWDLDRTPGGSSGGSAAAVCTGMATMAVGSDGGGSIRYPAGLTGVVGLKPQRNRVPVGPEHSSGWNGLLCLGPLTRSVRDAALFLDTVAADDSREFSDSINASDASLRIGVAATPPPGTNISLNVARRRQVDDIAALLSEMGHSVSTVEIDYGWSALWNSTVRLLTGVQRDAESLGDIGLLETRTRRVARLGRLIPAGSLRRARNNEQRIAASINRAFDHADVLLTPLCAAPAPLLDECPSTGALRSLRAANSSAWLVPWNLTGQPAMSIPTGIADGLPTAVQLVGRPHDETTLLNLAAQIEAARPQNRWQAARPKPLP